nr:hypothetical protein [Streptacidiphilus pinicola]
MVLRRAEAHYQQRENLYLKDPNAQLWMGRFMREESEAAALKEVLDSDHAPASRTFFVSRPALVGDHKIHVAISVDAAALARVPRLGPPATPQPYLVYSIIEAILFALLEQAQRDLYMPNPSGAGPSDLGRLPYDTPEISVYAISTMVRAALVRAGHTLAGAGTNAKFNALSSLLYEGRSPAGRLLIAPHNHAALDVALRFEEPVRLAEARHVRKLLEASGPAYALLMDHSHVYGLGAVVAGTELETEEIFTIAIRKGGVWQLEHGSSVLFTVRDNQPHLPTPQIDAARIRAAIAANIPNADAETLVTLARAAGEHRHGAMLIISSDAEAEAKRLAPQAMKTQPILLKSKLLDQLTNMDGGVLVDGKGNCHAVGVILDGLACDGSDPVRGSRFNNAARYIGSTIPSAVVLSYSSDGDVTIFSVLE